MAIQRSWCRSLGVMGLAVLSALCAPEAYSQQQPAAAFDTAAADRVVEGALDEFGYRGMAIAVTREGKVLYTRGYGVADDSGRPVTADTPFILGSTSKSFAGLAAMQLLEAGKLELDAPVTRYLPWFKTRDQRQSARITVRMLLAHTSGLPYLFRADQDIDGREATSALEEAVRGAVQADLMFALGSEFLYSNLGYKTLGLIVQTVSGEPYGEYLQRHVLTALRMNRTFTSWRVARDFGLSTGYSYTLGRFIPRDNYPSRSLTPEGGVISTANDLAHYLIAQAGDGRYEAAAVISPAGNLRLHTPFAGTPRSGYAMGWRVGHRADMTIVSHGGEFPGFTSLLALVPERQCGVAVLNNSMRDIVPDFDPTTRIGMTLLALCAGLPVPAPGSWTSVLLLLGAGTVVLLLQGFYFLSRFTGRRVSVWLEATAVLAGLAAAFLLLRYFFSAGVSVSFAWAFAPNTVLALFLSLATAGVTLLTFLATRVPDLSRPFV